MKMPHVVLNGMAEMDAIFGSLREFTLRSGGSILKASERYINPGKTAILVEALAIEGGVNRGFLAMVSRRDDGVVVRIYPRSDVEKTPGVKAILAQIARQVLESSPGLHVGETNLSEYLK